MQVFPSHTQRQLVSGKVGWGWRQATYPISVNFGFAGFLMLAVAIRQLGQSSELNVLVIACICLFVGFVIGIYTAKSVVEVCRQNSEYLFSQWQLMGIIAYWLVLIAGMSISSETPNEDFTKVLVALWWILPAAIFIGLASALGLRSTKEKLALDKRKTIETVSADVLNADVLNVVTYSDQTVLVSPSALGQQPRQFNSLVLITLGLFLWMMLDFSSNIRAIAAIAFTSTGLTGFFTWQAQLRSPERILELRFSGLWGIDSTYMIDLRPFSRLSVIKLQEASGELSWMQLAGNNSEITIPLAMTMTTAQTKESTNQNDQLGQTLREEFHLAKQETEQDSLGLAHVLLPQGAGILAGTAFAAIGGLLLFIFPLPPKITVSSAIAWLGVCVVSPAIARFFLKLVAPNSLQSDRPNHPKIHLQPWEIGTTLLLISTFLSAPTIGKITSLVTLNQALPLITLICGWLSITIGVCILAFVRRTPLWNINYI